MLGDKHYRRRRSVGKISNFIWSVTVMIILIIGIVVLIHLLTPWFQALLNEI